jgi:hypothetical protein
MRVVALTGLSGKCLTYNSDLALGCQVWADSSCQLKGQGWEE